MRIAIVNDMLLAVESLRREIASVPAYSVAWIARDGRDAVTRCREDRPDLVLMDLIMPVMDGVEATRRIMAESPCAILIVTASVRRNASKVYQAMGFDALDAVHTPSVVGAGAKGGQPLLEKIETIRRLLGKTRSSPAEVFPTRSSHRSTSCPSLVAIGASTGGPAVCGTILGQLKPGLGAAVIVVQHIDSQFASGLAGWLGEQSALPVALAEHGSAPQAGRIYVAPGDEHLRLDERGCFVCSMEPRSLFYRPSIDLFFRSVTGLGRGTVLGILLTGMGRDGAQGLLELRKAGHRTIAQDPASCVIDGMPGAAVALGAAAQILEPAAIAAEIHAAYGIVSTGIA